MAQEVHEGLAARLGEDRAGLITGEERINPAADHVACTTELVAARDVVVIDEVHSLADRDRGSAWTRALLSLPCRELHLVGSADILPALRAAFPDLEVRAYDRLAPLHYVGTVPIERVEPGTAVIAFSRKAVLALARDLSVAHPGKVGALYGAMPLGERKRQAAAFRDGTLDVLCATDVLGHGLNLPIRTVLFASRTSGTAPPAPTWSRGRWPRSPVAPAASGCTTRVAWASCRAITGPRRARMSSRRASGRAPTARACPRSGA